MYSLLLKNRIVNSALLVVLLILLRVIFFFSDVVTYTGSAGFLFEEWINLSPLTGWIAGTVLLIIQLYTIIYICLHLKLSSETTMIPGLAFVLCVNITPELGVFQPLFIANTLLLLALLQLLVISPRSANSKQIYNTGMLIAIGALFYSSFMFFLVGAVSGINILRSYRFNDVKILLVGFFTPFFLLGVYYFWLGRFGAYWHGIFDDIGIVSFDFNENWAQIGAFGIMMLLVFVMILARAQVMNKKTNTKQNYFNILYYFLFCCLLMTISQKNISIDHLLVLAVPLSIIFSEFLVNWKVARARVLTTLIILGIVLFQYRHLLYAAT